VRRSPGDFTWISAETCVGGVRFIAIELNVTARFSSIRNADHQRVPLTTLIRRGRRLNERVNSLAKFEVSR
jgi:hypothetical protein